MCEPDHSQFGAYLRALRKRCGLSLETVAARSRRLPQPISAPYLSRCERGLRLPGVGRLTSLSRVLDVPVQVLVERLAIESELQRMGLRQSTDLGTEALLRRLRRTFGKGRYWECFDASRTLEQKLSSPDGSADNETRDLLSGVMICSAWSAARLGCLDLCVHELREVKRSAEAWHRRESVTELLSAALLAQGNVVEADLLADELQAAAVERDDPLTLAKAALRKAKIADACDLSSGLARYREVDTAARALGVPDCEASRIGSYVLFGMGKCYAGIGQPEAARRATKAFIARASRAKLTNAADLGRIYLGYLETDRGAESAAYRLWSRVAESAEARDFRAYEFSARYLLLELEERRGRTREVERIRSRLFDLYPWTTPSNREYKAFRRREGLASARSSPGLEPKPGSERRRKRSRNGPPFERRHQLP